MTKHLNPAAIGALARQARAAAGLSQTELGKRISASRFWVAQFEKGKPGAELGLVLEAMHALGLTVSVVAGQAAHHAQARVPNHKPVETQLDEVIARATLKRAPASSVVGWPTAKVPTGRSRK